MATSASPGTNTSTIAARRPGRHGGTSASTATANPPNSAIRCADALNAGPPSVSPRTFSNVQRDNGAIQLVAAPPSGGATIPPTNGRHATSTSPFTPIHRHSPAGVSNRSRPIALATAPALIAATTTTEVGCSQIANTAPTPYSASPDPPRNTRANPSSASAIAAPCSA